MLTTNRGILPAIVLAVGVGVTQTWLQNALYAEEPGACVRPSDLLSGTPSDDWEGRDPAVPPPQVISQLTDPEQPGIAGQVDIVAASIEQSGGSLTFIIDTREPIPETLPTPADYITFLWLIDVDNDPATGQPHGGVGSEFNVRATMSGNARGGFVDVTGSLPGGGMGDVVMTGHRVEMTIGLTQIALPTDFTWRSNAFQDVGGAGYWNGETQIATGTTLPYTPPAHVEITTPFLLLSPSGPATGQLQVALWDADGVLLDNANHNLSFTSDNEAFATVDSDGIVTIHSAPGESGHTAYVDLEADGVHATNAAVIRSAATDLGIVHSNHWGENVSYYLPDMLEGVDLGQLLNDYQVVEVTDYAYRGQQLATGLTPFRDGTQYLVLDISDDPNAVPCGISGNPIRLGWVFGRPVHNSCFIVNDPPYRAPQWFVILHEMGHNFTFTSWSFSQFASADPVHQWVYAEGLASLSAMWSLASIKECSSVLNSPALDGVNDEWLNLRNRFANGLASYQTAGASYATIDPDILDGLLFELYDEYGLKVWFDLFSTFLPRDEPLPCTLDTEAKQATWFVAAISASVGDDLREMFTLDYGFPIDNGVWTEILACVQERIDSRPYVDVNGDVDHDCDTDLDDYTWFTDCMGGPDADVTPGCLPYDLDGDGHADLFDYGLFQIALSQAG